MPCPWCGALQQYEGQSRAGVQNRVHTPLPSRLKALHSIPSITKISTNPTITVKRRAVCQQDPLMLILKWRKIEPPKQ